MEKNKKGFTLVEIVIVIAVIAILSAVLLPVFSSMMENARESSRYQQAVNAKKELVTAAEFLPETTIGMIISVNDDHFYTITETGLEKTVIRAKNRLQEVVVDAISNENVKIYSKLDLEGIETSEGIIAYGIAYKTDTSEDSPIIYVDFEEDNNISEYFTITENILTLNSRYTNLIVQASLPYVVEEIGPNAFTGCTELTKIVFNSDIKSIGSRAFYNCSKLEYMYIPESVETIGSFAFYNCQSIKEIIIPEKVEVVEESTFYGCSSVTKLIIGNGVKEIKSNAFYRVNKIANLVIGDNVTNFTNIPYSSFRSALETVVLGKGITVLPNTLFYMAQKLVSVELRGEVTTIGKQAFYYCTSLPTVDLPSTLTTIEQQAFGLSTGFTYLEIPSGVTQIYPETFYKCSNLVTIKFLGDVTDIGSAAFRECKKLEEVKLSNRDSLITVGNSAFTGCGNLKSNVTGKNVEIYGEYAFNNCSNMEIDELVISNKATSIGKSAFSSCTKINTLIIEDGVEDSVIQQYAFSGTSFEKIIIGNDITTLENIYRRNAKYIEIGTGYTKIEDQDFYVCTSLEKIVLHGEITSIGEKAFYWCWDLAEFEIPSTVTSIGAYAFESCPIKEITLPSAVTDIPDGLFNRCSSLTTINISGDIKSIGAYAFATCRNLVNFNIKGTNNITYFGDHAFNNCEKLTYCPINQNGVVIDGTYTFNYCFKMTGGAIFSDEVTEIGEWMFNNAYNITHIVLGKNIQSIGKYAFDNCGRDVDIKVFYKGTMEEWRQIEFESTNYSTSPTSSKGRLCNKPRYYYLENSPTQEDLDKLTTDYGTDYSILEEAKKGGGTKGYWHYDENNEIVIW